MNGLNEFDKDIGLNKVELKLLELFRVDELDGHEGLDEVDFIKATSPFPSSCGRLVASAASLSCPTKVSIAPVRRPRVARSLFCTNNSFENLFEKEKKRKV